MDFKKIIVNVINDEVKLEDLDLCFFDLETTGLREKDHEIVEIAAKRYRGGVSTGEMQLLVKTERPVPIESTAIHGIDDRMLEGSPSQEKAISDFLRFSSGCVLVAHNAEFDYKFIRHHAGLFGTRVELPVICTLKMAKKFIPYLDRKNLDALANHYEIKNESRHRAYGDLLVTAEVFNRMIKGKHEEYNTWGDFRQFKV